MAYQCMNFHLRSNLNQAFSQNSGLTQLHEFQCVEGSICKFNAYRAVTLLVVGTYAAFVCTEWLSLASILNTSLETVCVRSWPCAKLSRAG